MSVVIPSRGVAAAAFHDSRGYLPPLVGVEHGLLVSAEEERPGSGSDQSSSIGVNEESSLSLSSASSSKDEKDGEVQSELRENPLGCLVSLEDSLPIKRGLSNFFNGKSKSFHSLSEAAEAGDLVKKESPFNKKRRILMECKSSWRRRASCTSLVSTSSMQGFLYSLEESQKEEEDEGYNPLSICLTKMGSLSHSSSRSNTSSTVFKLLFFTILIAVSTAVKAQLSSTFYAVSCPTLPSIVSSAVSQAVANEARMGASLVRLFFHDCFVNGCDASVLLDDTATFTGEKTAFPNVNSLRGFDVIDTIKTNVEARCPGVVSCADIVALAARDSVFSLGGPTWTVPLGRRDSTTASLSTANSDLPAPSSSLSTLISAFSAKGLTARDMTALSGAHTIGQSQCANFRSHIYNDANIDPSFAAQRQANCPPSGGDSNLAPLDVQTPNGFNNDYYKNLVAKRGLLHSDQELFNNGTQDGIVNNYALNNALFSLDFANAMIKMSKISPLTGSNGQVRLDCRKVN